MGTYSVSTMKYGGLCKKDTLKYSKMEILRNGNLGEKSAKFSSTIDPNAIFYKDFIYEKLDDFPPDSFLLSCISVDMSL